MRLIKCYITGFGRLKDFSYEFDSNINNIIEDNGWGKTTFSAFIKAMFYGLIYSPNLKSKFLDRNHYMPWDKGIFGGNLVFETDEGRFRVERTFGKSKKDDTFKLYDDISGKETSLYGENLGEELFYIDAESFEKTIFIAQDDLKTKITDKINAMVGNLSQTKDDLDAFESAIKKIDDAKKIYKSSSTKNPGKIDVINKELKLLKEHRQEIEPKNEALTKQKNIVLKQINEIKEYRKEKEKLREDIQNYSKIAEKNGVYQTQNELLNKEKEELKKLEDFFKNKKINEDDILSMEEYLQQIILDKRSIDAKKTEFPKEDDIKRVNALFEKSVPDENKIKEWEKNADRLLELRNRKESSKLSIEDKKELKELKEFFGVVRPTKEEIVSKLKNVEKVSELKGQKNIVEEGLIKEKEKLSKLNNNKKKYGSIVIVILADIFLLFASFVFLKVFKSNETNILGYISIGIAIIFSVGYFSIMNFYSKKKNIEINNIKSKTKEFEEQISKLNVEISKIEENTDIFLEKYKLKDYIGTTEKINEIQTRLDRLGNLEQLDASFMANSEGVIEEISDTELSLYTSIEEYASIYKIDLFHEQKEMEVLKRLKEDLELFNKINNTKGNLTLLNHRLEESNRHLSNFFSKFDFTTYIDYEEGEKNDAIIKKKIGILKKNYEDFMNITEDIKQKQEEVNKLKSELNPDITNIDIESMQNRDRELDEILEDIHKRNISDLNKLSDMSEEIVVLEDEQSKMVSLMEDKKIYERKYKILNKTDAFLKKAKNNFMEEYMGPLKNRMKQYINLISSEEKDTLLNLDYEINMDLTVSIKYRGQSLSYEYLSKGMKDMVMLCVRFALIDLMYDREKPIVILDDPFTAFDKDKIDEGLRLLEELSKDRQIIYFSCHNSRSFLKDFKDKSSII